MFYYFLLHSVDCHLFCVLFNCRRVFVRAIIMIRSFGFLSLLPFPFFVRSGVAVRRFKTYTTSNTCERSVCVCAVNSTRENVGPKSIHRRNFVAILSHFLFVGYRARFAHDKNSACLMSERDHLPRSTGHSKALPNLVTNSLPLR